MSSIIKPAGKTAAITKIYNKAQAAGNNHAILTAFRDELHEK